MLVTSALLSVLALLPLLAASSPVESNTSSEKPKVQPVKKSPDGGDNISCCALGYDYTIAAELCAYWDSNCGGFANCVKSGTQAYDTCLLCDYYNPAAAQCSKPLFNSRKRSVEARAAVRAGFTLPTAVGTITRTVAGFVFTITVNVYNEVFFRVNNPTGFAGTWNIDDTNTGWKTNGALNPGAMSEAINAYNVHGGDRVYFGVNAG